MTDSPIPIPTCRLASSEPDDWFIMRDGRQYSDEDFLTEVEERGIRLSVLRIAAESVDEHIERSDAAVRAAESGRRRASLGRRRRAKEGCWECPIQQACLETALEEPTPATHGTWGGYFEEELVTIRVERTRRRRRAG